MSDILDPSAVLSQIQSLLSNDCTLKSPQDALVALIHSIMIIVSFRLVGIDDSSSITHYENNALPVDWSVHGPGGYTLRYKHEQSSLEFVVKVSKLGLRTVINAIALESDKTASLDIKTDDYTSASFFPYTLGQSDEQPVVHGFISSHRVKDLIDAYKLKIIQKLVPGLRKEGYTESEGITEAGSQTRQDPRRLSPEYSHYIPSGVPRSGVSGPSNPLSIGRQDLEPIATHPNPFIPRPLFGGPAYGDGMIVGPNHPIFTENFTPSRGGRPEGPWGGDGFLPPIGAPPGARFDPIVPANPPFGPGRRGPQGAGLRHQPTRSGEPDNDELMPPGMSDMYM